MEPDLPVNGFAALEQLQRFVLEQDLPRTEMALFGVKCPYCGKSDRILPLEPPDDLEDVAAPEAVDRYRGLLVSLALTGKPLGVCKFCRNVIGLSGDGPAEPLMQ